VDCLYNGHRLEQFITVEPHAFEMKRNRLTHILDYLVDSLPCRDDSSSPITYAAKFVPASSITIVYSVIVSPPQSGLSQDVSEVPLEHRRTGDLAPLRILLRAMMKLR